MATICFDSSKIGRHPNKIKPILPGKMRRLEPVITCHDLITLKSLHFLIYENEIAAFGSAKALAAIDNITGRVNVEFRGLALTHCSNSATPFSLWPVYSKKIFMTGIFKMKGFSALPSRGRQPGIVSP